MSTELLHVDVEPRGGDIVVTLSGSADMDQLDQLGSLLLDAARAAPRKLILVLSGLTFICSAGLGLLIQAHNLCHPRGVPVVLVGVTPPVQQVLCTTRLTKLMEIVATVDDAIAAPGPGDIDTAGPR